LYFAYFRQLGNRHNGLLEENATLEKSFESTNVLSVSNLNVDGQLFRVVLREKVVARVVKLFGGRLDENHQRKVGGGLTLHVCHILSVSEVEEETNTWSKATKDYRR
jgi:hypothetical protein